jgi:signal transduction histidine kinase
LRHEFLKHRIGAAGEALHALIRGQASPEQRRFLEERLCKGEPLLAAWRTHVGALERSLGLKFALTRGDPLFRGAQRALAVLGRVATMTRPADARRVEQARDSLERLDRELAELVARLAYCPVDEGFLRDVLVSIRSEWASGKVELDDISVGPVPEGVAVDVYRTDLRIVLKNILRNAISALAESPHPRRLAVDVLVELEPTGEEVVRIRVRDSSTQPVAAEVSTAAPTGVEHGLGIVRTALLRYDGSLEIAPGTDGYAKAVVVRLFRSQATHPEPLGEAA